MTNLIEEKAFENEIATDREIELMGELDPMVHAILRVFNDNRDKLTRDQLHRMLIHHLMKQRLETGKLIQEIAHRALPPRYIFKVQPPEGNEEALRKVEQYVERQLHNPSEANLVALPGTGQLVEQGGPEDRATWLVCMKCGFKGPFVGYTEEGLPACMGSCGGVKPNEAVPRSPGAGD